MSRIMKLGIIHGFQNAIIAAICNYIMVVAEVRPRFGFLVLAVHILQNAIITAIAVVSRSLLKSHVSKPTKDRQ